MKHVEEDLGVSIGGPRRAGAEPEAGLPKPKSPPRNVDPKLIPLRRPVGSGYSDENDKAVRSKVDGRSARATGQSAQMNIKVQPEIRQRYVDLKEEFGASSLGELVTEALELLITSRRSGKRNRHTKGSG